MTSVDAVIAIRSAETVDEAVVILKKFTTPAKIKNAPPSLEDVWDFARERALKDGDDVSYYLQQAEKGFDFYTSNMEVLGARTWKDSNGNQVKNWKLRFVNNWFK